MAMCSSVRFGGKDAGAGCECQKDLSHNTDGLCDWEGEEGRHLHAYLIHGYKERKGKDTPWGMG